MAKSPAGERFVQACVDAAQKHLDGQSYREPLYDAGFREGVRMMALVYLAFQRLTPAERAALLRDK